MSHAATLYPMTHGTTRHFYQAYVDALAPGAGLRVAFTAGQWWLYIPVEGSRRLRGFAVGRANCDRILLMIRVVISSLIEGDDDEGDRRVRT